MGLESEVQAVTRLARWGHAALATTRVAKCAAIRINVKLSMISDSWRDGGTRIQIRSLRNADTARDPNTLDAIKTRALRSLRARLGVCGRSLNVHAR